LCVLVGCVCYLVGFYGLYVIGYRKDTSVGFWVLCVLSFIAGNGGTWLEAAALSTTIRNFEAHRGAVVGILKAFLGLSASVYTTLYITFCNSRLEVLQLLAFVPSSIGMVAGIGVNLVPFRMLEKVSKEHAFHIALYATLSLAIYQLVTVLYFNEYSSGYPLKNIPEGVVRHPNASQLFCKSQSDFRMRLLQSTAGCLQGLLMCCAVLLLMVPIISLPLVFGGIRAAPLAEEIQSRWAAGTDGAIGQVCLELG
jgi:hypothetical protein